MIQLQNQRFTNNTLHKRKCSTELLVFSKVVLKKFANFTGKHPCRVKCEPKSLTFPFIFLFIYFPHHSDIHKMF